MAEQDGNVEVDLIRKASSGDIGAFEQIFLKYKKRIYNYCLRMAGNHETAKEATQDIFIRVFKGLKSLRDEKLFGIWIMRIASNHIKDVISKKKHELKLFIDKREYTNNSMEDYNSSLENHISPDDNPEEKLIVNENKRILLTCLSEINQNYREILILHYIEEIKIEDLSEITGLPEGTIKSRLSRGRAQMAEKFKYYQNKEGNQ